MTRQPNFLYIGTSKAGSTWIYNVLAQHPDVFMAPGKGLYFFDNHYHYGLPWYRSQFQSARDQRVVGEISHSYLFSRDASQRIASLNRDMQLMVCLREPVDRAFSAYLDGLKNGEFDLSFREAIEQVPSLVNRGRYATHLEPYLEQFGRERIHVGLFDVLRRDPRAFASELYRFLGVRTVALQGKLRRKQMPAAEPRCEMAVAAAKKVSSIGKRMGLRHIKGKLKTSPWIRDVLYRPYTDANRPKVAENIRAALREHFRDEIYRLDHMLNADFRQLWGY